MLTLLAYASLFTILGILWFGLDGQIGLTLYGFIYNLTHSEKLSEGARGFILGQKARGKFYAAFGLGLLDWYMCKNMMTHGTVVNFFLIFVAIIFTMVGFYCGPLVIRFLNKREQLLKHLDKLDQIESGEIQVGAAAKKKVQGYWHDLFGNLGNWKTALKQAAESAKQSTKLPAVDDVPIQTEPPVSQEATTTDEIGNGIAILQSMLEKTAGTESPEANESPATPSASNQTVSVDEVKQAMDEIQKYTQS